MTNNPKKRAGLIGYGLEIIENVPLIITPNPHNAKYLQTKKGKCLLKLDVSVMSLSGVKYYTIYYLTDI